MHTPTIRRTLGLLLAATMLVGSATPAAAQEEPPGATIPAPSLEAALAVLLSSSGLVAADTEGVEPARVRLPVCRVQDIPTRYRRVRDWKRTLLDTNLKLPRSYKPWDLVSVSRANLAGSGRVRKIIIRDLTALAKAARTARVPLAVRSAYRTYDYQKRLFDSYTRTYGYEKALTFSARPGHSEHQLGTTIDFTTAPGVPLTTKFGDSPAGLWLASNGWKYGFIMMYPKGKKRQSCYSYEPWHWRYFGRSLAKRIHQSGQVPRRFLYVHFETAP